MFFPCGFLGGMVAVGVGNGIIKRSATNETAVKLTTKERNRGARLLTNDDGITLH